MAIVSFEGRYSFALTVRYRSTVIAMRCLIYTTWELDLVIHQIKPRISLQKYHNSNACFNTTNERKE